MKRLILIGFLVWMVWMVVPVYAQDTAGEIISVEDAGGLILAAITAIVAGGLTAPITTFIVSVTKRIPLFAEGEPLYLSGPTLNLLVGGVITIVGWLSIEYGFDAQLDNLYDLVLLAGPALLNFYTNVAGSSLTYQTLRARNVALMGHSRSLSA